MRNTGRRLYSILGLVIAAASLWLAFRNVEWSRAVEGFGRISLVPGLAVLCVVSASVLTRALLWRRLASRLGHAPLALSIRSLLVGMLANNVLPARLGEIARSALWALRTRVGHAPALGVLAAERSLDLVALGIFALAVLPTAPLPGGVRRTLAIGAAAGVAVALVFVVLARVRPSGVGRLSKVLGRLAQGFATLGRPREMVVPALLSATVWCLALAYQGVTLWAFGIRLSLPAAALLLVATQLAVVLPSAPSFAGPYHLAVSLALVAHGIDRDRAAGFALFSHLAWVVPTSVAGAVSLVREGLGLGSLVRPDAAAE